MDKSENEHADEEIEEEMIVFANFEEGTLDREIFQNSDFKFKVIGLDSETPIVQLGDHTFKGITVVFANESFPIQNGAWNDTIGTKVFFDEDPSPQQVDPVFTVLPPQMLKYKCMANKTLELSRIFLKPKSSTQINSNDKNVMYDNIDSAEEHEEVSNLIQSTISPNLDTIQVMNNIIAETAMEVEK